MGRQPCATPGPSHPNRHRRVDERFLYEFPEHGFRQIGFGLIAGGTRSRDIFPVMPPAARLGGAMIGRGSRYCQRAKTVEARMTLLSEGIRSMSDIECSAQSSQLGRWRRCELDGLRCCIRVLDDNVSTDFDQLEGVPDLMPPNEVVRQFMQAARASITAWALIGCH
jgi:hypothetical protein